MTQETFQFARFEQDALNIIREDYPGFKKVRARKHISSLSPGTWSYSNEGNETRFPLFRGQELFDWGFRFLQVKVSDTEDHYIFYKPHLRSLQDLRTGDLLCLEEVIFGTLQRREDEVIRIGSKPLFNGRKVSFEEFWSCPWEKVNSAQWFFYQTPSNYYHEPLVYGIYKDGEAFFYFIDSGNLSLKESLFLRKWKDDKKLEKKDLERLMVEIDQMLESFQ